MKASAATNMNHSGPRKSDESFPWVGAYSDWKSSEPQVPCTRAICRVPGEGLFRTAGPSSGRDRRTGTGPATFARAWSPLCRSRAAAASRRGQSPGDLCQTERRRAEADLVPRLEQPPADVDVIAGDRELRIEPADLLQRRLSGTPCCSRGCARPRDPRSARESARRARPRRNLRRGSIRRRHVRPADAGICAAPLEREDEIAEPLRVGACVVVQVGQSAPRARRVETDVPGGREAVVVGVIRRTSYSLAIAAVASVEPSFTTITS